jgi:hypothetical protein
MKHKANSSILASSTPNPFAELDSRLDTWRATRRRGERIPEELWTSASQLARLHGLSATATVLKLNYYALQRRLKGSRRTRTPRAASPAFVTLPTPPPHPLLDPHTLEITKLYGDRLTLNMPRAKARDFLLWMMAFLRS